LLEKKTTLTLYYHVLHIELIHSWILFQPQPQYPNINFAPSLPQPQPPPPAASSAANGGARLGFNFDANPKVPFHDPFPQVPTSQDHSAPPPAAPSTGDDASDDTGFDDLARRFEELKRRK